MSKNKKNRPNRQTPKPDPPVGTLPDLGDPEEGELKADSCQSAGEAEPGEGEPSEAGGPKPEQQTITIEIPIGALSTTGYITRHVEVNHLSTDQQHALNRLLNGLRAAGAKLTDRDKLVDKPPDAVRWLLDRVAAAVESNQ